MSKKPMNHMSNAELCAHANKSDKKRKKALKELNRRWNLNGKATTQRALARLGVIVGDTKDTVAALEDKHKKAKDRGVTAEDKPKSAKKTRKIKGKKSKDDTLTKEQLEAMSRQELLKVCGIEPGKRTRSKTLINEYLSKTVKAQPSKLPWVKGFRLTRSLTDEGHRVEIVGESIRKKDGTFKKKKYNTDHKYVGLYGVGATIKDAMDNLRVALEPHGVQMGGSPRSGNYIENLGDQRTDTDHLLRSNKSNRRRTANKSAVLTADMG